MVETIATTSPVLSQRLFCWASSRKNGSYMHRPKICTTKFMGQRVICVPESGFVKERVYDHRATETVRALAAELTKEAYLSRDEDKIPRNWKFNVDTRIDSTRLWPPANKADDPALHNPLLRQERMGCGWLGVVFEWEGVIAEDDPQLEKQAWLVLSQEEGKSPPPAFLLKRIEGMKNEQALSEVLCWSRDPSELRRLASRKEEICRSLHGGFHQLRPGSQEFMNTMRNHKVPMAVVSTRPKRSLQEAMEAVGINCPFDAIVTAEDVYRGKPDPEMFVYASQLLNLIPERCIVFGNSNSTVEAAHDARMKCVAVASKHPLYELGAADLVVRRLTDLSVVDLKNLIAVESSEFGYEEPEVEMEEERSPSTTAVATEDHFW